MKAGMDPSRPAPRARGGRSTRLGRNDEEENLIVLGKIEDYRKIYAQAGYLYS